ncbi:hypothetical protein ACO1DV_15845 [Acinetobacter lwoffii]|uniref:hypothetical protein n=1 Tax=Acinetobacter lwoffii TaxID=28090 RepID=UPI003BF6B0FE
MSQLALKDPNIVVKPIAAEDLPEIKQALDGMGVNQKLDFIGNMITEAKGIPNGEKIWKSALTQLGGADRTYYLAGLAQGEKQKNQ